MHKQLDTMYTLMHAYMRACINTCIRNILTQLQALKADDIDIPKLREICEGEAVGIPAKAVDMTLELLMAQEDPNINWKRFVVAICAQVSGVEDVTGFVRLLMDPAMFGNDDGMLARDAFITLFDWW
jgi:hypothetical protein